MTGEQIKEIRIKLFMTQREFSETIGVHHITVSDWENGKVKPSLRHQKKINELAKELKNEKE